MPKGIKKQAVRNKVRVPVGHVLAKIKELKYGDYVSGYGTVADVGWNEHNSWFIAHSMATNEFTTYNFPNDSMVEVFRYEDLPEKKPLQHAQGAGTIASRKLKEAK